MLNTARLYYHTLWALKPSQVLGRVWRHVHTVKVDLSPAPARRTALAWTGPARREPSWLSPTRRRFLNAERNVSSAAAWNDPQAPKLWLYNLHYFEDLCAANSMERHSWHVAEVQRWRVENEPGSGCGWEAYPLSLRITNWIKWELEAGPLDEAAVHSLAVQARFLRESLETHLLGNHLFANAKALIFAGCFFEGPEANEWLNKGLLLIQRELREQVLKDGGHFERSPMYHSLCLEDLLDLINLKGAYPQAFNGRNATASGEWPKTANGMRNWLAHMTHPDGELALFNDCAMGVAPTPEGLHAYARRLGLGPICSPGPGLQHLAATGFIRMQTEHALAILDVGEIGPSYLPGHAHADSLSFELSLFGERCVVDSGTSLYQDGEERLRQRSTSAHNTIVVDDQNSSEIWSSFRVARRAFPKDLVVEELAGGLRVACSHDGYLRLPGRVVHRREWTLERNGLLIRDQLSGSFSRAAAHLHLHPAVRVHRDGELHLKDGQLLTLECRGAAPRAVPGTWHPQFGISTRNTRLELSLDGPELWSTLRW